MEDVFEYFALGGGEISGFRNGFYYERIDITSISSCKSEDVVAVNINNSAVANLQPVVEPETDVFHFEKKSRLLNIIDTSIPTGIVKMMLELDYDRQWFCDVAAIRCPGELYPYSSINECYEITATIPDGVCTVGVDGNYMNGVFQGDTSNVV